MTREECKLDNVAVYQYSSGTVRTQDYNVVPSLISVGQSIHKNLSPLTPDEANFFNGNESLCLIESGRVRRFAASVQYKGVESQNINLTVNLLYFFPNTIAPVVIGTLNLVSVGNGNFVSTALHRKLCVKVRKGGRLGIRVNSNNTSFSQQFERDGLGFSISVLVD